MAEEGREGVRVEIIYKPDPMPVKGRDWGRGKGEGVDGGRGGCWGQAGGGGLSIHLLSLEDV